MSIFGIADLTGTRQLLWVSWSALAHDAMLASLRLRPFHTCFDVTLFMADFILLSVNLTFWVMLMAVSSVLMTYVSPSDSLPFTTTVDVVWYMFMVI